MSVEVAPRQDSIDELALGELAGLADLIRTRYQRSREHGVAAVENYLAIGHCLLAARAQLRTDRAYGAWLQAQAFPFNRQRAYVLREAARNETAVRAVVASQLATGDSPNIESALWGVRRAPKTRTASGERARLAPRDVSLLSQAVDRLARAGASVLIADMLAGDAERRGIFEDVPDRVTALLEVAEFGARMADLGRELSAEADELLRACRAVMK